MMLRERCPLQTFAARAGYLLVFHNLDEIGPALDAFKLASIMARFIIVFDVRKVHCRPTLRALWMRQRRLMRTRMIMLHLYAPKVHPPGKHYVTAP